MKNLYSFKEYIHSRFATIIAVPVIKQPKFFYTIGFFSKFLSEFYIFRVQTEGLEKSGEFTQKIEMFQLPCFK
jgi:hypothetical protein